MTTSTLAAIVVNRLALLGFKAFEPRIDMAEFEKLCTTFHEETINLLVRNIEPADYPFARSNETVGGVTKELPMVCQRLGGPRIDIHTEGRVLADNN